MDKMFTSSWGLISVCVLLVATLASANSDDSCQISPSRSLLQTQARKNRQQEPASGLPSTDTSANYDVNGLSSKSSSSSNASSFPSTDTSANHDVTGLSSKSSSSSNGSSFPSTDTSTNSDVNGLSSKKSSSSTDVIAITNPSLPGLADSTTDSMAIVEPKLADSSLRAPPEGGKFSKFFNNLSEGVWLVGVNKSYFLRWQSVEDDAQVKLKQEFNELRRAVEKFKNLRGLVREDERLRKEEKDIQKLREDVSSLRGQVAALEAALEVHLGGRLFFPNASHENPAEIRGLKKLQDGAQEWYSAPPSAHEPGKRQDPALKAHFLNVDITLNLQPPVIPHRPSNDVFDSFFQDAQKNIVGPEYYVNEYPCVVFGIGISTDSGFEQSMARRGCVVHAFDCTISADSASAKELVRVGGHFHKWCVGSHGANRTKYGEFKDEDFKRLQNIVAELGVPKIDLLKFDIEGFEWALFEDEILTLTAPPLQLAFELHSEGADPNWVPRENTDGRGFMEVNKLFLKLYELGYRVVSKEINSADWACAEFVLMNVKRVAHAKLGHD